MEVIFKSVLHLRILGSYMCHPLTCKHTMLLRAGRAVCPVITPFLSTQITLRALCHHFAWMTIKGRLIWSCNHLLVFKKLNISSHFKLWALLIGLPMNNIKDV